MLNANLHCILIYRPCAKRTLQQQIGEILRLFPQLPTKRLTLSFHQTMFLPVTTYNNLEIELKNVTPLVVSHKFSSQNLEYLKQAFSEVTVRNMPYLKASRDS